MQVRTRRRALLATPLAFAALVALQPTAGAAPAAPKVVTVGTAGNEPIVVAAPDGTLYVSALQHLYVSTDRGASWRKATPPVYAGALNLASDSSIAVDPGNRLYFTFDWPYVGGTATCTSDDRAASWFCNPMTVPGVTDRMWVTAPATSRAYHVTNAGLYETVFSTSSDRGTTYVPAATSSTFLQPQTGPLLPAPDGRTIVQPVNGSPNVEIVLWSPPSVGSARSAPVRRSPLPRTVGLPSGGFTSDGVFYLAGETATASGDRSVRIARTTDLGSTWTTLPPVTGTGTGAATFTALATGRPGDVGVLFYATQTAGDPQTAKSRWSVKWARTTNAHTAKPTWTVTTLQPNVHTGHICAALACDSVGRFAGDFISATIDRHGTAHLVWMTDGGLIRYAAL